MTSTPPEPGTPDEPHTPPMTEPDYGKAPPPPPGYGTPPPGGYAPPPGYAVPPGGYAQPGYPPPGAPYGANPGAPWGVHPISGIPYSDKQKLIAGILQILLPFGIGQFYIGNSSKGVAQLLVTIFTCGIGAIWSFVDGIIILTGEPVDQAGRPLRP